jgi:hypothetical protein
LANMEKEKSVENIVGMDEKGMNGKRSHEEVQ